jgi:hypothetical protein
MEIKELSLTDLINGYYAESPKVFRCIFCGRSFRKGEMYLSRGKWVDFKLAIEEHIADEHGSVFEELVGLDKKVNGLTDMQKAVLSGMYKGRSNQELSDELKISAATVRTHKFNLQKMKREAEILLAIFKQIDDKQRESESETLAEKPEKESRDRVRAGSVKEGEYPTNSLHPFFTNIYLK